MGTRILVTLLNWNGIVFKRSIPISWMLATEVQVSCHDFCRQPARLMSLDRLLSIDSFMSWFTDEFACTEHLASNRWPDEFVCSRCGGMRVCRGSLSLVQGCSSVLATVNDRVTGGATDNLPRRSGQSFGVPTSLRKWFIAAYLCIFASIPTAYPCFNCSPRMD